MAAESGLHDWVTVVKTQGPAVPRDEDALVVVAGFLVEVVTDLIVAYDGASLGQPGR